MKRTSNAGPSSVSGKTCANASQISMMEYVREQSQQIRLTSAVPLFPPGTKQLPLNLILLIISHLDDISDIARVTRTSRLLYYLTLPRLYEHVTLRSYSSIRYIDGKPQGYGGGSPFCTALDGLVSSSTNVAGYVKGFSLLGDWREVDSEDFSKGRVPDNTMILNVAIRAALERTQRLETFRWELTTKPMRTVYQCLALRTSLTSLKIRLSSSRIPRPTILVPAIPSLRIFHLLNIDPLCYPDDFSLLLQQGRNIEDLGLSWSPRMRNEREPTVNLHSYFGRVASSKHKLKLKHIALANLYAQNDPDLERALDRTLMESITFINCVNPDDPTTVFMDHSWRKKNPEFDKLKKLGKIRTDAVDGGWAKILATFDGLREIYMVNNPSWWAEASTPPESSPPNIHLNGENLAVAKPASNSNGTGDGSSMSPSSSSEVGTSAFPRFRGPRSPSANKPCVSLASDYIAAVTKHHGKSLRKLLLSDQWSLEHNAIMHIANSCPNLEQVGLAFEGTSMDTLREFAGALPKLRVLRVLLSPDSEMWRTMRSVGTTLHELALSRELWKDEFMRLRWVALGGFVAQLGGVSKAQDGAGVRRIVKTVSWEDVKHLEVFGMDSTDI